MEEKIMVLGMIAIIIGVMVLGVGIYYLAKEKNDPESKKIYTITSVIGALVTAAGVLICVL